MERLCQTKGKGGILGTSKRSELLLETPGSGPLSKPGNQARENTRGNTEDVAGGIAKRKKGDIGLGMYHMFAP